MEMLYRREWQKYRMPLGQVRKEAANDEGENIRPSSPDAGEVREDAE